MKNSTFKIEFPRLALIEEDRKRTQTTLLVFPRAKATTVLALRTGKFILVI